MAEPQQCNECNNRAAYACTFDEGCCDGAEGGPVALCEDCATDKEEGAAAWTCPYHTRFQWTINGCFSKFGNSDGNSYYEFTGYVVTVLEENGCEVEVDAWGSHNQAVIVKITRGNAQLYPPPEGTLIAGGEGGASKPFVPGYDDVFLVLPNDIASILRVAAVSEALTSEGCAGLGGGGDDY